MTPPEPAPPEPAHPVAPLLRAAGAPGAAVALTVNGRSMLATGVGYRDLARGLPLVADARCYAYSVTKTLLAVAALRLVEQGRLDLDVPMRAVLPEVALDAAVTVRRLLNHTGGLPDYGAMPEYAADLKAHPDLPWTVDEFLARTLPHGPIFPPGAGWAYSNIGYLLIRQIIERLTRRSLREVLADLIFAPLGLRRTEVAGSLADAHDLTPGYSALLDGDGELHDISRRYHPGWVSHGVVITTAPELARILDALFTGRLVEPTSVAQMLDAVEVPGPHHLFAWPAYGLGLMVDLGSPHGQVAGHGGGGPGYSAAAIHFPDLRGRRVTAVALANRDRPDLGLDLAFKLAEGSADPAWSPA